MTNSLVAQSISKHYPAPHGEIAVLSDASLSLDRGEALVIMGPSGSGKSTLLNILGTLETPTSGSLQIDNTEPFNLSEKALAQFRNQQIGFIFQDHHLLPQCTALENILIPTLAAHDRIDHTGQATQLLKRVGLSDRSDHRPAQLSGGERQRVAIARALINQPTLLLADEPTGNLDRKSAGSVADLLFELQADNNVILVAVTHSNSFASRFSKVFDLIDGCLTERDGSLAER